MSRGWASSAISASGRCTASVALAMSLQSDALAGVWSALDNANGALVLTFISTFVVADAWMAVYDSAVEAVFLCYLVDQEENDGVRDALSTARRRKRPAPCAESDGAHCGALLDSRPLLAGPPTLLRLGALSALHGTAQAFLSATYKCPLAHRRHTAAIYHAPWPAVAADDVWFAPRRCAGNPTSRSEDGEFSGGHSGHGSSGSDSPIKYA